MIQAPDFKEKQILYLNAGILQNCELKLRNEKSALEQAQKDFDIKLQRQLDEERKQLFKIQKLIKYRA